jgi:SAM-dependent methyltransferase
MSGTRDDGYILGTDPVELDRLGLQHRLWSDTAHRLWLDAGVRPGSRVLDVGCGPGYASADLAQLVGDSGRVVGVDESEGFVGVANRRAAALGLDHLTAHRGDVHDLADALDAPDRAAGFDAAFARWVLCFVRDPGRVITSAASLLRPGGRFVAIDYFNYEAMTLAPREPVFDEVVGLLADAIRERGGDPDVMGRVPRMATDAGLAVRRLSVDARLARPGEPMWDWPSSFWKSFLPRMVEAGRLDAGTKQAFDALWDRASEDPHRFIALPPVWLLVAEKPPLNDAARPSSGHAARSGSRQPHSAQGPGVAEVS